VKWGAVVVAAGSGRRLGRPKQFIELAGLPMVGWCIQTFAAMHEIVELVIATEPESIEPMRVLAAKLAPELAQCVVRGGATRQDSAREAIAALGANCEAMFVHDGARPLITARDVRAGMAEVRTGRGALLAERVVDTIKKVDPQSRRVVGTLERNELWAAQTPQFAMTAELRAAHLDARNAGVCVTDDAALLERMGIEVIAVAPAAENFKVTIPPDVARAESILLNRRMLCHPELVEG
jgi:2-C-methyl-D-erythritol 4-phosphate cytidylyltransferase